MNITKAEITKQSNRAKRLGWLPYFTEAVATITSGYFDVSDLLAVSSRETNLDPKWLAKKGDGGHGAGLLQADDRSFPVFTKGDGWRDARTGILFGAKVLMQKWHDYESNIGKRLTVKSSKGGTFRYTAQKADGADAQKLVISSFNCGRWSQYALASNQDLDKYSTGGDYAADVMVRARIFRELLKKDSLSTDNDGLASPTSTSEAAGNAVEIAGLGSIHPAQNISGAEAEKPDGGQLRPDTDAAQNNAAISQAPDSKPVEVEQVKPEPQDEKKEWGIKASLAAAVTFITTSGAGVLAVMREAKTEIIYGFFGAATVVGIVFIIARFIYIAKKEKLESDEKMAREQRAADLQLKLVESASRRDLNTVSVVPITLQNSEPDEPKMFAGGAGGSW